MRALTVQNPWASAMFWSDPKDVENRSRNIAGEHRGTIAVHAGQRWSVAGATSPLITEHPDYQATDVLPFGSVIGVVDLVDVHTAATCRGRCSRWAEATGHHLELTNPRRLTQPVEAFGKLGLWTLPSDVFREVRRQLQGTLDG
jgi:hypothetical protein